MGSNEKLAERGLYGFDRLTGSSGYNGNWIGFLAINNVTFNSTSVMAAGDAPATGDFIPAGTYVMGPFQRIGIATTDIVYAYRATQTGL